MIYHTILRRNAELPVGVATGREGQGRPTVATTPTRYRFIGIVRCSTLSLATLAALLLGLILGVGHNLPDAIALLVVLAAPIWRETRNAFVRHWRIC